VRQAANVGNLADGVRAADEGFSALLRVPTMTSLTKLIAVFVLIVLASIATLSFWSAVRSEKDQDWIEHTHMVLERLQAIRIDLTGAERAQRSFVLTGQDGYLEVYGTSIDRLGRDIATVRDLTSDNPGEQQAISRLQPLIAGRVAELADGITLRKQNGVSWDEALTWGKKYEGWMELIGTAITGMRHTEAQLLSRRLDLAKASTRRVKIVIVCGNALAILILLVAAGMIDRESRRCNRGEQELKHSNEQLERRSAELSDANVELESFAYSVAHDLRAPLRHIAGYSEILAQDYASQLDAEALRCLGKIEDGAHNMGDLVDDLLHLSKIGQRKLTIQNTSLSDLLALVIKDLEPECSGREITWRVGELFSAECDPGLMKQVFVNLLSNAVKYTRTQEHAVIEVGQASENGEQVVFVRDNGVGFDMQYAGKLFGVFQRLHKARDFEGTGVGLAIVQRILRKHGGRIWVEAELNRGATFFFTLGSPENSLTKETTLTTVEEKIHAA
jgi:signal transduction histidine kinase